MEERKAYLKKIKEFNHCGNITTCYNFSEYRLPSNIEATKGEHSLESCANCKEVHLSIIESQKKIFLNFPTCCAPHSKLIELAEFDRLDFVNSPQQIADKTIFTYHHFINNIETDTWKEEISDYIDYAVDSLGDMPEEYGSPYQISYFLDALKELVSSFKLDSFDVISRKEYKRRFDSVIYKIDSFSKDKDEALKLISLLFNIYNEWFNIFPFELEYFTHLKDKFSKLIPVDSGKTRYNKYQKRDIKISHNQHSLVEALTKITGIILTSINGLTLHKEGKLRNVDKIALDLIVKQRELELIELNLLNNESKSHYIKVLKKWFSDEKGFIKEITPFLSNPKRNQNNSRPNRTDLAYFVFYTSKFNQLALENVFPSDKAWEEIGQKFQKNAKNIQTEYNKLFNDKGYRLKLSKVKNIEYVINSMLGDYDRSLALAKDELAIAKLKS